MINGDWQPGSISFNAIRVNSGVEKYLRTLAEKLVLIAFIILIAILKPAVISAQETDTTGEIPLQPMAFEPTGIYALKAIDSSRNGEGVKYAVICRSVTSIDDIPQNDYRPAISHNSLSSGNFTFYQDNRLPYGISAHATSICSILFGEDENAYHPEVGSFYYLGVVPKAQADVYEFNYFIKNNVFKNIPPDADIITASLGSQFEEIWTRGMESLAERYGIVVVAGIGNGTKENDPVLYPAAGSNAIGVGVIDSLNTDDLLKKLQTFALAYPEHSSTGPTIDGRCKPDIVAPGDCLAAVTTEPDIYEPTGNWSSFATPVVSGAAGLLIQKAKEDTDLSLAVSPYGGNCVIKAILLNSATKLPFWHKGKLSLDDDHTSPLDYIQGAGMLNALGAYDNLTAGRKQPGIVGNTGWDLNQLSNTKIKTNIYQITIDEPADKYITATLCWNRHFENKIPFNPLNELNSDLRLEIWAIDNENPDNSYQLDYSDSPIDNVEHIYVKADPNITNYDIVLSVNSNNYEKPDNIQRYGLAWNVAEAPEKDSNFWYDLDANGSVDTADMIKIIRNRENSLKNSDEYLLGDIDLDGQINQDDIAELINNIDTRKFDGAQISEETTIENDDSSLVSNAD